MCETSRSLGIADREVKRTGSEPPPDESSQEPATPADQAAVATALERARLQAEVAKQRVRLAKEELKRARKRVKEAKREAKAARKQASATRKAWKKARKAHQAKGSPGASTGTARPRRRKARAQ